MIAGWIIAALFALGGLIAICAAWRMVRREETWLITPRWVPGQQDDRQDPNANYSSVRAAMNANAFVPGAIYRILDEADVCTFQSDEEIVRVQIRKSER